MLLGSLLDRPERLRAEKRSARSEAKRCEAGAEGTEGGEGERELTLAPAGELDTDLLVDVLGEVENGLALGPVLASRAGRPSSSTCTAAGRRTAASTACAAATTSTPLCGDLS